MPRFSVIIVSYDSEAWVAACLAGMARQDCSDFEVILVDNASRDQTVAVARDSRLPQLQIIESPDNLGFAAGSNLGARHASGDWLVFLNPDTIPRPDWLSRIADGQADYPDDTVFACTQYNLDDDAVLDGVGDAYFGFGIPWRGGFGHPASRLPDEGECFSPCGAAAVIRADVFRRAGGFDERFFCYCEDVDLGFRLRLMGERCIFLNKAAVDHKGGGVSGRYSDFTIYHGTRNRLWTYVKNMPLGLLLLTLPGHILISLYLLGRSASVGRFGPTWRGLRDGVKGLPAMIASRGDFPKPGKAVSIARAMAWNVNVLRQRSPHVRALARPHDEA